MIDISCIITSIRVSGMRKKGQWHEAASILPKDVRGHITHESRIERLCFPLWMRRRELRLCEWQLQKSFILRRELCRISL